MEPKEYTEEIDFRKYWLVLKRRFFIVSSVFSTVLGLTVLAVLLQKPNYEASGKLLVKTDRTSSLTGLDVGIGDLESLGSSQQKDPLTTQAEIIKSLPIAQKTIQDLHLEDKAGKPLDARDFLEQLKVKGLPATDVLQISYQYHDPELAAAVVNTVMQAYKENNVDTNRAEAIAARRFIEQQLPQTEEAVRQAETRLSQFKEQNKVIALDQEATQAVTTIGNLDSQIDQAQAQLADINAQSAELRRQVGMNPEDAMNLSALSQASGVQEVLTELQKVQSELATQRTRYRETHPTVISLERRTVALNALLGQRVAEVIDANLQIPAGRLQLGELKQSIIAAFMQSEVQRVGLQKRIQQLTTAQAAYQQRATVLPSLEKTQRELERRLKAAQTTYETLLTKLQEVQVAENQNLGNARVIEEAIVPEEPADSRKKLILAAGGFAGLLLGIAVAFLLDLLDQSIKTVKESRELFGYTLLGIIPAFNRLGKPHKASTENEQAPRVIVRDMPYSPVQEAYQMLQANLKFLSSDRDLKAIVVTSSVVGEGKSEVSANLAAAIAQVGRKVLVVDADMRHPAQHAAWELTNAVGLSHVIVNQNQADEAIQEVMPNLHVLTSGVMPPNPVALLDSKRMAALINNFSSRYDFVIIDAPPVVGFADASVLGRMVDGILMVVRPGIVNISGATAAKEALSQSGQNVLGLVANGVDVRNEPDSYFYYTRDYSSSLNKKDKDLSLSALDTNNFDS